MSQFEELLAQLDAEQKQQETMAKSIQAGGGEDDDKAIQAAAAEGGEAGGEGNPEDDEDKGGGEGAGEGGEPIAKSIKVGEDEFQVVDAEALIKSLNEVTGRVTKAEETLVKGLESALKLIKGQGDMIKSLQGQIGKLAGQGTGRKTVLTVLEKPGAATLAKSQQDGMTTGEFLAKSEAAFNAKKITGLEFTKIDVSLRQNQPIDQGLIAKVLS